MTRRKKFALIGNPEKPGIETTAADITAFAARRGAAVVAERDLAPFVRRICSIASPRAMAATCDAAIALGGDGTVLKAAHSVGFLGLPILGVNLGSLGFLAETPLPELHKALDELIAGKMAREERTLIAAEGGGKRFTVHALNEIVIDRRSGTRMIRLETFVDGNYLNTYVADGIIVATPTGSTAYSLSAGGPIISPSSRVFVVTPLAPHALTARPLIVPDSVTIRISVSSEREPVALFADGREGRALASPAVVTLRRAQKTVTFLRRKHADSYDVLRAKLFWGKDTRAEKEE